ncbi:MAG: flagellar M-ring protein FliF C-terminal domain-containing protein [Lachnospiraceae bacterium]|nr:flagellar M-ring protein FliF C-terminal domain-containing protein [Lachnospiraceae bacterium]
MQERIQELLNRIKEWWNKFTTKQKTIIIAVAAVVVLAMVILVTVLTRPQYTALANCETAKEASEITALLDSNDIKYEISSDGLSIRVNTTQESQARLLLGANDILAAGYGIENVTDGGISTTEADKQKKYVVFLEKRLENDFIRTFSAIKSAHVMLHVPDNDGTLISKKEPSYAWVQLELQDEFTVDQAAFLAKAVSTALGNDDASRITIMDTDANLLYSGENDYSVTGSASSQLGVKEQAERIIRNKVTQVMLGTNLYSTIEVSSNLDIDFAEYEKTKHTYSAPEGMTQGLYAEAHIYNSESTNGNGGVPGTDSNLNNDRTTYMYQDFENSNSSTTEEDYKYVPNETIESEVIGPGVIKYENSSLAATAISYNILTEEDAKKQGLLDGITWEEYKAANNERTKLEIDPEMYQMVANATGIAQDRITIMAYSENWFIDAEGMGIGLTDIVQIILIFVILGLLGFVVLRSMKSAKPVEEEEELSVENLLQSTPDETLGNIEAETKSEIRLLIEKFVDENPEAAAVLLRNWLDEDWGA